MADRGHVWRFRRDGMRSQLSCVHCGQWYTDVFDKQCAAAAVPEMPRIDPRLLTLRIRRPAERED